MNKTTTVLCLALLALVALPTLAEEAPQTATLEVLFQAPAEQCEALPAGTPSAAPFEDQVLGPIGSRPCNQTVCSEGEFCCNFSCSICAPHGGYCTQQYCPPVS